MSDTMLLRELLQGHYAPLKGISRRTERLYEMTLTSWSRSLGREPEITDLNEIEVARFIAARKATKAAATAKKDCAQVRALWEFAARRQLVDKFPIIPRVKVPQRVPEAWLTEQVSAILAACDSEPGQSNGVPHSKLFRALVMLLYETGERISAALALEWQDIAGSRVLFRAETRKNAERDILRSLSPAGMAALDAIRDPPRKMVFPWGRARTHLWMRYGAIIQRAGLPGGRRSKFHKLRRTCASYYVRAGGNAQTLLDHSSPSVTKKYLDPRITETDLQACDVLPQVG
jgi:integrase